MEKLQLGNSDIEITPIIMGTWQAGKTMWTGIDDNEIKKAIRAALEAGVTTFDTATVYGDGHSERILGKALAGVRDRVVIATKVFAHSLHYGGVIAACNQSLADLGTDYIDLYQIHWPAGSFGSKKVTVEETMRALCDLKDQGKIRAIGVSNFSRQQVAEAGKFGRIDSLQPPYSLFWRQAESDGIPYCRENGITVLAYSPMAQGILTGKFGPNHQFEKGDHRAKNRLFAPNLYPKVLEAVEALHPIAEKHGATLAQLALAWVIAHDNTGAIAGARNAQQATANAAAADVRLSYEDLAEMDRIGRTVTDRLDDNPVMWAF
jgi:aryl-alcohol dehydrogenase-like predicted oxidoreductase